MKMAHHPGESGSNRVSSQLMKMAGENEAESILVLWPGG